MRYSVSGVEEIARATVSDRFPNLDLPEVAVVGRSNVGKSTLINTLTSSKIARASATPGRTRQIHFIQLAVQLSRVAKRHLLLVDLPGFGFAKFSKEYREQLSGLTVEYLRDREQLSVVCILNDCRRLPKEEERAVQRVAAASGRHVIIILTKTDKLKTQELTTQRKVIAAAYGLEEEDVLVSNLDKDKSVVWERILVVL